MSWVDEDRYPSDGDSMVLGQRLHDEGLVYAINRLVLHPLGLALATSGMIVNADAVHMQVSGLALLASADPEGIVYGDDEPCERALAKLRAAVDAQTSEERRSAYGNLLRQLEGLS